MSILNFFRPTRSGSASVAKNRLQIIMAHERERGYDGPHYLPALQRELLEVVRKYVQIDKEAIKVNVDKDGDYEVLELNITLPEEGEVH